MKKIFVGGSRNVSRLNLTIHDRLFNIISKNFQILVGDANGADKAIQKYLFEKKYKQVSVYCSGHYCRNNVGSWKTIKINTPKNLNGRKFYMVKDLAMAKTADFGFMLWDGKSAGTLNNIFTLLAHGKKAALYFSPDKEIYTISSISDLEVVFSKCKKEELEKIDKKIHFSKLRDNIYSSYQTALKLL